LALALVQVPAYDLGRNPQLVADEGDIPMRPYATTRIALPILACTLLTTSRLPAQSPGVIVPPAAQAMNLRMQRVLARFVERTGQPVLGVGSWISNANFNPVTSDFDMRLLVEDGLQPAEQARRWREARNTMTTLIQEEFGAQSRNVLGRTNLYAPNQLMAGVEDVSDALERYQRWNAVPALSYNGPVNAGTPASYAEGVYGAGSQTYVQAYERKAGRLFYNNNGRAVTGLSELAHLGETMDKYTPAGTANTAGQWAEHALVEVQAGQGARVAKYLDRLERDLIKSRSLSGLPLDEGFRSQLQGMRDLLKKSPGRISEVAGDVTRLLSRGRAEAAILGGFENAGPMRRAYLRVMLDGVAAGNKLGVLLDRVMAKMPSWVDADNAMNLITFAIGARAAAQSLGQGDDVFEGLNNVAGSVGGPAALLGPLALAGPALLTQVMTEIILEAKANGYEMAAGSQEAWDLMAGVYSAWGRAGVDPDARRKLTLADLVARYQYEPQVEALVLSQAIRASTRGLGSANEQADDGVAQAIFAKCWPAIRDAWRWERDMLASEYLKLASGAVHVPLVIYFKPAQPRTGEAVNLEAVSADGKLGDRFERMKQIMGILYGPGSGIAVNYYWTPAGTEGAGRDYQRRFTFAEPGPQEVKVRMEVSPFTRHTAPEPRVMLKRVVEALVDVDVQGASKTKTLVAATAPEHAYTVGALSFRTPIASFGGPPGLGVDIGNNGGDGTFAPACRGTLSGNTFSCSAEGRDGDRRKTMKATYVFSATWDRILSFSFESEAWDYTTNIHWTSKAAGVDVPLTTKFREIREEDYFSVNGAEVCKHVKTAQWTEKWDSGSSFLSSFACNGESKLEISFGWK
jgi:hypothetical protein